MGGGQAGEPAGKETGGRRDRRTPFEPDA